MSTQTRKDPMAAKHADLEAELAEEEAKVNAQMAKENGSSSDESAPSDTTPASTEGEGVKDGEGQPSKPETTKPEGDGEGKKEEGEGELDPSQLSEKAQKRFKELADENKRLKEEAAKRGSGQPAAPASPGIPDILNGKTGDGKLPWDSKPSDNDGGTREITQEEYEANLKEKAKAAAREEINNERTLNQLRDDTFVLEDKYPVLREKNDDGSDNPDFDATLVQDIAEWYKKLFKEDHSLRLLTFVDKLMSLRSKGAEQGKAQATETLKKQAASQAVDPSGTPSSKGSDADLESQIRGATSMKELEALEKRLPHA